MNRVKVVAGIIFSENKQSILIAKRLKHLHQGGYWEFPGGKLEVGELELDGLRRELKEELSVEFERAVPFEQLDFDYTDKQVSLSFWSVFNVCSEVCAMEGQEWQWVPISELYQYKFPAANKSIVQKIINEFN